MEIQTLTGDALRAAIARSEEMPGQRKETRQDLAEELLLSLRKEGQLYPGLVIRRGGELFIVDGLRRARSAASEGVTFSYREVPETDLGLSARVDASVRPMSSWDLARIADAIASDFPGTGKVTDERIAVVMGRSKAWKAVVCRMRAAFAYVTANPTLAECTVYKLGGALEGIELAMAARKRPADAQSPEEGEGEGEGSDSGEPTKKKVGRPAKPLSERLVAEIAELRPAEVARELWTALGADPRVKLRGQVLKSLNNWSDADGKA